MAKQVDKFLQETGVDELIVVSNMHAHADRIDSYRILSEIIKDRNN